MNPADYVVVADLKNASDREMRIFLEMTCEEIFLDPGHEIQLLAKPSDGLLPITIHYVNDGLQVFAAKEWDPDWHIRFMGAVIKPNFPTRLAELQTS